jgi:hypothetical protein
MGSYHPPTLTTGRSGNGVIKATFTPCRLQEIAHFRELNLHVTLNILFIFFSCDLRRFRGIITFIEGAKVNKNQKKKKKKERKKKIKNPVTFPIAVLLQEVVTCKSAQ